MVKPSEIAASGNAAVKEFERALPAAQLRPQIKEAVQLAS